MQGRSEQYHDKREKVLQQGKLPFSTPNSSAAEKPH
jgi:hypothetical protein